MGRHLAGERCGTSPRVARRQRAAPSLAVKRTRRAGFSHQWALNELPDQGSEALIHLIVLIEEKCDWPNQCNQILFIAKAAGGVRPIGLLFAIMRVQCKLRRIEAKMWEATNTEGFFWGTQARGVERCVWEQAAWSEWAPADGHAVAAIFYDLLKAFDHVAYQKLIIAAVRTRSPVRPLQQLPQLCQAARHVELDGVAGEALQAQRGIIPGCAFATTLLLLVGPLREVRAAHPTVSVRVDDLSLQRFADHLASTCMAAKLMQAGCEIATKKSNILSNSMSVWAKLQAQLQPLGVQVTRTERNLGNDFASGKRVSTEVRRARLEKSKGRQADHENPRHVVGAMAATAGAECACLGVKSKLLRCGGHWAQ